MSVPETNCSLKQLLITSSTNINNFYNMLNNYDFDTSCNHEIFLGITLIGSQNNLIIETISIRTRNLVIIEWFHQEHHKQTKSNIWKKFWCAGVQVYIFNSFLRLLSVKDPSFPLPVF